MARRWKGPRVYQTVIDKFVRGARFSEAAERHPFPPPPVLRSRRGRAHDVFRDIADSSAIEPFAEQSGGGGGRGELCNVALYPSLTDFESVKLNVRRVVFVTRRAESRRRIQLGIISLRLRGALSESRGHVKGIR